MNNEELSLSELQELSGAMVRICPPWPFPFPLPLPFPKSPFLNTGRNQVQLGNHRLANIKGSPTQSATRNNGFRIPPQ